MQKRLISSGSVHLEAYEHGSGPQAVVLVHGFSASARIWAKFQRALDPALFRSIAISNRGAGGSSRGSSPHDYTIEAFARDLYGAVGALELRDILLIGHSLGAATAAQFALDHPGLLNGLVLLNPVPLDGDAWRPGWQEELNAMWEAATHPTLMPVDDFERDLQADAIQNPIERRDGSIASMATLKLRQRLSELPMPVLVVGGDRDTVVDVNNIVAEYLALPAATRSLHIFHSVGHAPNVELPERLAGTVRRFVQGQVLKQP